MQTPTIDDSHTFFRLFSSVSRRAVDVQPYSVKKQPAKFSQRVEGLSSLGAQTNQERKQRGEAIIEQGETAVKTLIQYWTQLSAEEKADKGYRIQEICSSQQLTQSGGGYGGQQRIVVLAPVVVKSPYPLVEYENQLYLQEKKLRSDGNRRTFLMHPVKLISDRLEFGFALEQIEIQTEAKTEAEAKTKTVGNSAEQELKTIAACREALYGPTFTWPSKVSEAKGTVELQHRQKSIYVGQEKAFVLRQHIPGENLEGYLYQKLSDVTAKKSIPEKLLVEKLLVTIAVLKALKQLYAAGITLNNMKPADIRYDPITQEAFFVNFDEASISSAPVKTNLYKICFILNTTLELEVPKEFWDQTGAEATPDSLSAIDDAIETFEKIYSVYERQAIFAMIHKELLNLKIPYLISFFCSTFVTNATVTAGMTAVTSTINNVCNLATPLVFQVSQGVVWALSATIFVAGSLNFAIAFCIFSMGYRKTAAALYVLNLAAVIFATCSPMGWICLGALVAVAIVVLAVTAFHKYVCGKKEPTNGRAQTDLPATPATESQPPPAASCCC